MIFSNSSRRQWGQCVALGMALFSVSAAWAQSASSGFPNKPVRIVVPQTPGGASDALARMVGQKLSEK